METTGITIMDITMDITTTAIIFTRDVIKHTGLPYNSIWEACLYVTEN